MSVRVSAAYRSVCEDSFANTRHGSRTNQSQIESLLPVVTVYLLLGVRDLRHYMVKEQISKQNFMASKWDTTLYALTNVGRYRKWFWITTKAGYSSKHYDIKWDPLF